MNFSVAMSVYKEDNPIHFREAINSVINQTFPPSEIILVIDGPVSKEIMDEISEIKTKCKFLKTIWINKNLGHGNSRKVGISNCLYDLVAIMDSDDISLPDRFEKQINYFKKDSTLSVVGGYINEFIDEPRNIVGIRTVPTQDKEIKQYMKSRCPMNLVTVMIKKSDVLKAGGFIDWYCEEDYFLWVRMMKNDCKFANIEDNLVNVRVGLEMYKRRGGWKYFKSETKLQLYMLKIKFIGIPRFLYNTIGRFVVQVLLPNQVRGLVFQKCFRKKYERR